MTTKAIILRPSAGLYSHILTGTHWDSTSMTSGSEASQHPLYLVYASKHYTDSHRIVLTVCSGGGIDWPRSG
jgi:hypothetical protein